VRIINNNFTPLKRPRRIMTPNNPARAVEVGPSLMKGRV
jgi:hypothetical protein